VELKSGKKKGVGAVAYGYSFGQGHFEQWSTCWRSGLMYQRRRDGCIFIRPGAFQIMEYLLAMSVIVPASSGRMPIHSARGNSDNGALVGDEG
jgi:hypothetical protein